MRLTKTTQANLIASLKRRVKKLEKKRSSRTHKLKRLYKVGLSAKIFDMDALTGDEVFAEQEFAAKDVNLTIDEVTLAQVLAALKSVKPKVKDVIKEPSVPVSAASAPTKEVFFAEQEVAAKDVNLTVDEVTLAQALVALKSVKPLSAASASTKVSAATASIKAKVQDKGKGKMVEPEPIKPTKKKVIMLDKDIVLNIQAEIDEEERIARLAERLQAEEQEQFTIEEKATLFKELLEQRRKHFAAKRAEEKRNKPSTKTQQKKTMITYLKNMEDLVKGSSKRPGEELEQESTKKQKVDDDKETTELKQCLEIILDKEEIYMLVEKKYPLAPLTLSQMLEKKLQIDYESEMAYQLYKYQVYGRIVGIKSFLMLFGVTAALIDVNAAQSKNFNENYFKCLRLLVKIQLPVQSYYC
ncbi:hypothetical protein Tco_1007595 [Tanacetum coccineum]